MGKCNIHYTFYSKLKVTLAIKSCFIENLNTTQDNIACHLLCMFYDLEENVLFQCYQAWHYRD